MCDGVGEEGGLFLDTSHNTFFPLRAVWRRREVSISLSQLLPLNAYSLLLWLVSQRAIKPRIRPLWLAKTQVSLYTHIMARIHVHPSLDSPEAVEATCDQWKLWSDCAGRTSLIVGFVAHWLNCLLMIRNLDLSEYLSLDRIRVLKWRF